MIPVLDGQDAEIKIENELYLMVENMKKDKANFPQMSIVKVHFLERIGHGPWTDSSASHLTSMFITGFPHGITEYDVKVCIESQCKPKSISLPKDRDTGKLRGKGYVDYENVNDLGNALKMQFEINGKQLYTVPKWWTRNDDPRE